MKQTSPRRQKQQAPPSPLILVQLIRTRWEKSGRGAPEASARNRVPEALVLPPAPPDTQWPASYRSPDLTPHPDPDEHRTPDLFLQLVAYGGYRYEKPAAQYWTALTSRLPEESSLVLHKWDTPPILFQGVEDGLAVRFSWHEIPGAPARHSLHLWERRVLKPNQWLRIHFNARHTYFDGGGWYYTKHVLNIGLVEHYDLGIFINSAPDVECSDLARLF